jgi:phenylalanyl-tRNA synthetase alpha chain
MQEILEKLALVRDEAITSLRCAGAVDDIDKLRVKYLGKKGLITEFLKGLGDIDNSVKPVVGKAVNDAKRIVSEAVEGRFVELKREEDGKRFKAEAVDITLAGKKREAGKKHPLNQVTEEVLAVFSRLGFLIKEGPEIETEYYNFEALNMPKLHPARDMQDTFYIGQDLLLRTHTSPVQIRVMEEMRPPLRVVAPGKVYRRDADITHSPMFHQIEGFMVDERVTFADLKGVLSIFCQAVFGEDTKVRFRPSFFPFTEPSAEVDISCVMCGGKGCRVCKMTGWLEILGAGMIHPEVFRAVHYDAETYSGFAFGMGIERIAMLKYGIGDIRLFYENDVRFLAQF